MDLDALGLNSTFESTELQASYQPPVDRVDTSDIEGPEDFTMNMTYWMTADLPLAQIKSRKEAKGKIEESRMDALQEERFQENTEEGDQAVAEDITRDHKLNQSTTASPTRRANGTSDQRTYSTPPSERSMENEEKVRSFLSALPDTDMEGAIGGTPLHVPRQSFLQVPQSSPPKNRSLQPTVEDYDTPRKPTQETVIHHTSAALEAREHQMLREKLDELQSRLDQQELASKTRITELETILSYTRSELESARTDNYRQNEMLAKLRKTIEQQKSEHDAARSSTEAALTLKEKALDSKMHEFGEEMRLQNMAKLQSQREDFERQIKALEESKRLVDEEVVSRGATLTQVQNELANLRETNEQVLKGMKEQQEQTGDINEEGSGKETMLLKEQLTSVQNRASSLQAALEQVTTEARLAREDAKRQEAARAQSESRTHTHVSRITELETNLQAARFELECAQADIAAKQQLFHTNLDLNSRLRVLRNDLETNRNSASLQDQHSGHKIELESRISSLQAQLESLRAEVLTKDQEIYHQIESQEQLERRLNTAHGRVDGLETTVATLRQQLAEAHRDSAKARTDAERYEHDLEDVKERLEIARTETNGRIADMERKLNNLKESKLEVEKKFKEFRAQHDDLVEGHGAMLEDARDKAEDAVRKTGALLEQERSEKRRIIKDLKRTKDELERLRQAAQGRAEDDISGDEDSTTLPTDDKEKDVEIENLQKIIRQQVSATKTLKSEMTALRKENKSLKTSTESFSDLQSTIDTLESELEALRTQNTSLQESLEDQEAINAAMDEKLATMLSKLMKERAKTVVGKRDGQWAESVSKVQDEREILGKVLLRQWGREEVGIANEKQGEPQVYKYKYVKR